MTRDEMKQAINRAFDKLVNGIENLNDAQLVYMLGVVDGMEGSAAAIAACTVAATQPTVVEFQKEAKG